MATTESKKVSAVDIKRLWYCEPEKVTADLTGTSLKTLLSDTGTKEIINVHQDTWSIEEAEPSQDSYKNQLTNTTYRMGTKTMGDVTFNWTIGQYDYALKAEFMGGTATGNSWKRARGIVEIKKCLIALTEDDQYCVLPYANINTREANTDGAIGLAVIGTMLEPTNEEISPEYWFDASELTPTDNS